jgi:SAM-dependent methyltransferase
VIRATRSPRIRRSTLSAIRTALASADPRHAPLVEVLRRERRVPIGEVAPVLRSGELEQLVALGVVTVADDAVEPCCRLDPLGGLLIASDTQTRRERSDFVVGPGPASLLLARFVPRQTGGRLLDLGCGSGFQGLARADARTHVTAIDINPRALAFTRFNASINGRRRVVATSGDFLGPEPDRRHDGRFDTVVANPPFVLSPTTRLLYRDRSLPGDGVGQRTVERVARALAPGGRGYVLCNWIDRGGSWAEPVRGWTRGLGRDVAVERIRTLGAADYVSLWTRTAPPTDRSAIAEAWRAALADEGVEQIHVGVIELRRLGRQARTGTFTVREAVSAA